MERCALLRWLTHKAHAGRGMRMGRNKGARKGRMEEKGDGCLRGTTCCFPSAISFNTQTTL